MAPHAWMDQLRFLEVKTRLARGEAAKAISEEIGFTHAPQFSYWCKRLSGMTPSMLNLVKRSDMSHFRKSKTLLIPIKMD